MGKLAASIILPCKNEGVHIHNTVFSLLQAKSHLVYEIIVVDDGSTDGCCDWLRSSSLPEVKIITTPGLGAAQARNVGAAQARSNYLVFCDAHVFVEHYWLEKLIAPLELGLADGVCPGIAPVENPDNAGWGQTINEQFGVTWLGQTRNLTPVPVLPGGCLAVTTTAFQHIGGFDEGSVVWGHEDVELSIHLWLYGYTLAVNPQVKILHVFRPSHPYTVTMDNYYYNLLRIAVSHFNQARISKIISMVRASGNFDALLASFLVSYIWDRRQHCLAERRHDDDWLMNKFGINF